MAKTIHTPEQRVLVDLLVAARQRQGMTQVQLAEKLGQTQSSVSKIERGEIRLDILQLRNLCRILGTTLPEFVIALEKRLKTRNL